MSERPDMTPTPWPPDVYPSDHALLPWFLAQSTEAQLWMLRQMREAAAHGHRCWTERHDQRLGEYHRETLRRAGLS